MTNFAKCIHLEMRLGVSGGTGQKWRARTEGIGSHSRYLEPAGGWTEVGLTGPGKGKTQANYSALSNLKCMLRNQSQILIKITGTGACIVFPLYLTKHNAEVGMHRYLCLAVGQLQLPNDCPCFWLIIKWVMLQPILESLFVLLIALCCP